MGAAMTYTRPMSGLFQWELARHRPIISGWLDHLVRAPLLCPAGHEALAVVGLLCQAIRSVDLSPSLISPPPPSEGTSPPPTIVASFGTGSERTVYLHGRYRATPASDPRQFTPWWDGDTFFGRGTADMMGGVVSMIAALLALRELETPLVGKVVLVLVPGDDDSVARQATSQLAELGVIHGDGVMYTPQPTAGVIWNASRGIIRLRVTVRRPSFGEGSAGLTPDAMTTAMPLMHRLFDLRHRITPRQTAYVLLDGPAKRSNLVIGGEADGGLHFEAREDTCWFDVERRLNPEESFEDEKRELLAIFTQAARDGIPCAVEILEEGRASGVPSNELAAVSLERAVCKIREELPRFLLYPGLLDTEFYAHAGVPALASGPGHAAATTGMREFVKMESVLEYAAIYAMTVVHLVGDPSVVPLLYS
jgi:succinyl-diaminopimelate desuccinylase